MRYTKKALPAALLAYDICLWQERVVWGTGRVVLELAALTRYAGRAVLLYNQLNVTRRD